MLEGFRHTVCKTASPLYTFCGALLVLDRANVAVSPCQAYTLS